MSYELTQYQKGGRIFKLLGWIAIIIGIFMGVAIIIPAVSMGHFVIQMVLVPVLPSFGGFLYIALGNGIMNHNNVARIIGITISCFMLLGFPIGTVLGLYILHCLFKDW